SSTSSTSPCSARWRRWARCAPGRIGERTSTPSKSAAPRGPSRSERPTSQPRAPTRPRGVGRARAPRRWTMMKWFLGRSIGQFERRFEYDATYLRHLLEVSPEAFLRFSGVKRLGGYVRDVPPAVFHAASIRSALRADCGPFVQLAVRFAELDGVDPSTLRAIVKGEL